uniref:uncharacterized protein LOC108949987 n=1 Tax=Ciona intestinalis TaxID=7719 RepID=UPI000EF4E15B|nr:uncharacterized protein LOC108949987 [Ciona intestinalis]|eukprot:XP_026692937.1 uncharacterized protein LOC108949987 [Ciona intestinalis]
MRILKVGGTVEDFRRMYKDVDVVVDAPAFLFWEQILEVYPDAKVIISIRDEEKWFQSFKNHLHSGSSNVLLNLIHIFSYSGWCHFRYCNKVAILTNGSYKPTPWWKLDTSPTVMKNIYRHHNSYVLQRVPKDQLLVFDLNDGWAPLCEFLGKEIPDKPFPFKNKSASFISDAISHHPILQRMIKETILSIGTLTFLGIYCGYKIWKRV